MIKASSSFQGESRFGMEIVEEIIVLDTRFCFCNLFDAFVLPVECAIVKKGT
jgi:hypothetical protein